MRNVRIAVALTLALGFVLVGANTGHVAAQDDGNPTFNIFAYGRYCVGGGTGCSFGSTLGEYTRAGVWGQPGHMSGAPVSAYAECNRNEMAANGHLIDHYEYAGVGPGFGDQGIVLGIASLGPSPNGTNTAATGRVNVYLKDSTSGDQGYIMGTQTANNELDTVVPSRGFTVTLTGTVHLHDVTTGENLPPGGNEKVVCSTGGTPIQYSGAENMFEPYDPNELF